MAEKPEKAAKEEPAEKSGSSNMPIVAAVMLMGLLNVGAIGGLGYFMVTKMQTPPPAVAKAGGHGEAGADGEDGGGGDDHGGGGDDHGGGGGGGDDHGGGGDDHGSGGGGGKKAGPPGIVQQMANIVVRLKDIEREHHARISLALEFKPTAEKAAIEASLVRVREAAIAYASDRRYDEMRGSRGMLDMKKFLNKKARELYGEEFSELYVTEFVAQ